jgi:hypothetical protein
MNEEVRATINRFIQIGVPLISIFILTGQGSDPVNVTKFLVLGGVAMSIFFLTLMLGINKVFSQFKTTLIILMLLIVAMVNSVIQSEAPIQQNLYGEYGRVTGFMTYLFMIFILVGALTLSRKQQFQDLLKGLLVAGQVNIFYGLWVLIFGDPIGWDNKYGSLLGLFGNPDFISAFLGMYIALVISTCTSPLFGKRIRIYLLFSVPVALFEIIKTHAIQGLVVTAGGVALVVLFFIRSKWGSIVQFGALLGTAFFGFLAILGTLQQGPLDFVYKRSVSLRGTYWRAGYEMGIGNLWSGIGMDTYGDWYRKVRPPVALVDTPGVDVSSNVSHNVLLDFFAYGGLPLFMTYVALLSYTLILSIKYIIITKQYDPIFIGLFVVWITYQTQSVISINQIGLTVWGWAFTGALIGYVKQKDFNEDKVIDSGSGKKLKKQEHQISPGLVGVLGLGLGFFLAAPPIAGDSSWMHAINSKDFNKVTNSLTPSYFNPPSSMKYSQAVEILSNSNFPGESIKYARIAVNFNPNNFYAWRDLYFLPDSTEVEKQAAKANMKRLDPLNPKIDELK